MLFYITLSPKFTVMTMNLKTIVFSSVLSCMFFTAGAQGKNYGILTIKKEDIQKFYDGGVASFVFKYKKPFLASYKLEGTPFDASAKPVLNSFKPQKVHRHDKKKLENLYKGILFLFVQDMKDNGIDGTFDIYLVPKSNSKFEGAYFVSYLINNTPDEVVKPVAGSTRIQSHAGSGPPDVPAPAFRSFNLNPSPPYRPGEQ